MTIRDTLIKDLKRIGVDVDSMTLEVRPYHSRYFGRYLFDRSKVFVYIYADKTKRKLRPYVEVLETAIHEATHHMISREKAVARGETHNQEFHEKFKKYMRLAARLGLLKPLREGGKECLLNRKIKVSR